MKRSLANIFQLGVKELYSLRFDPVMLLLILYMFSFAVFEESQNATTGVVNASVAIVDEDRSQLSRRIGDALLQPYFQAPHAITAQQIDSSMEAARYAFVLDIPPKFQADLLSGKPTAIQLNVDATAMGMAGTGSVYIQHIISQELSAFLNSEHSAQDVKLVIRAKFNPNLETKGFQGAMALTNNITMMAILLTGAALIREREHGTIEHLLVMPLSPVEIMLAKVWANGLVVIVAACLSLYLIVRGVLGVTIIGSIALYFLVAVIYLFSVTSLGIYLATLARSMPQYGLLAMIVFVMMMLLSGSHTPLDSAPVGLQFVMQFVPSTHFVSMAQAILFRNAGVDVIWPQMLATAAIGAVFFLAALMRFRKTVTLAQV